MEEKNRIQNEHEETNETNTMPVLKKKPVVKILMEKKEVIYASEAAGYCSDQC